MALQALAVALDLTNIAAAAAPIPYLGLGVTALQAIIMLADAVPANKEECQTLGRRCHEVLVVIIENSHRLDKPRLEQAVQKTVNTLIDIQQSMTKWSKLNRTDSFFKQRHISHDINNKQLALHDCCTHLNLVSQLAFHHWTQELEEARQKDQALLLNILQTQEEMLEIMKGLQLDLRKQPENSDAHKTSEAQLLGLHTRSGQHGLPISELRGECRKIGSPVGGSSAYDIYEGLWLGKQKVALKALRGVDPDQKKLRRFHRQVEIWSKLKSPYILNLYGARYDDGPSPYLVSPWLHNGNAVKFLQENPDSDRVQLSLEVAYGLQYLHCQDPPIVHGGLQGSSILISDSGCAVLADFGLSKALEKLADTMYTASNGAGASFRWMAPELQGDGAILERSCDVYSWGMTALQLITDKVPFYKIKSPGKVVIEVAKGKRPLPQDYADCKLLNNMLWALFERCWQEEPSQRPTIDEVVNEMEMIISWSR